MHKNKKNAWKAREIYPFNPPALVEEDFKAVERVLRSGWVTFGKESVAFEIELAEYVKAKDGAVVNSCTSALHLALILQNVKPGDEIITTPMTFAATANAILYVGAKPVFVDIRPDTLNIDETKIEAAITKKTRGILPVHFGGLPCNMKAINKIAKKHGLFVVEDAAHALGARVDGRMIGGGSNIACFSFYANKNLTTVDGGFFTVPNKKVGERARRLRIFGMESDAWKRFHNKKLLVHMVGELGFKYNTNDVLASMGRTQLRRYENNLARRKQYAKLYDKEFSDIPGITLQPKYFSDPKVRHSLYVYSIVIDPQRFKATRDEIIAELRERGIFAVVHYQPPVHLHKFFKKTLHIVDGMFPVSEYASANILTIPLIPQFSERDARHIADTTRKVLIKLQK